MEAEDCSVVYWAIERLESVCAILPYDIVHLALRMLKSVGYNIAAPTGGCGSGCVWMGGLKFILQTARVRSAVQLHLLRCMHIKIPANQIIRGGGYYRSSKH